jgi:uncharacterized RDD family membrane protein YckC
MKCPKCNYLGFETGDRCKNCGYDFSLLADSSPDPTLRDSPGGGGATHASPLPPRLTEEPTPGTKFWLDRLDQSLAEPEPARVETPSGVRECLDAEVIISLTPSAALTPAIETPVSIPPPASAATPAPNLNAGADLSASAALRRDLAGPEGGGRNRVGAALPLFTPPTPDDDEPLIKLPAAPRPPLAVRRTPDTPRLRAVPRAARQPQEEPELQFVDEPPAQAPRRSDPGVASLAASDASSPGRRVSAAIIDHGILAAIDVTVVYFALRMAGLQMSDWALLPPLPMVTFLSMIKFAYFWAFTAVGGQTIGKMAVQIYVAPDTHDAVMDGNRAFRRTLAGVASILTLGLGFFPLLFVADRRAFHDRVAHTRVVRLRVSRNRV